MARYQLENGTILDTVLARQRWREAGAEKPWTRTVATSETLSCSSKGRYWLEAVSSWRGIAPTVRVLTPQEAAVWLVMHGYDMPPDLVEVAKNIEESSQRGGRHARPARKDVSHGPCSAS